jgi:ubiquinone biosynthesis protein COQ4
MNKRSITTSMKNWFIRHRIKPITALRAIRQLLKDPDDTGQVFKVIEALKGDSIFAAVDKLREHPDGMRLLAEKPDIKSLLNDRDALAAMPQGSIGRAYYDFVHGEGLSADGLVASSEEAPRYDTLLGPDERWFADRLRDIHDLQHVMTGYGRDPIGEISLLSFMVTQVYNRGIRFIIFVGSRKFQKEHPDLDIKALIAEGKMIGERAAWMPCIRWEDRLHEQLSEVRSELGFTAPDRYKAIQTTLPYNMAVA